MRALLVILLGGLLFGTGLAVSQMARPEVVLGFLQLSDFGLLVTMACALAVTLPIYQIAPRRTRRPALASTFDRPPRAVQPPHVVGAVLFGIGWGISGVCPGAAFASLGIGNWPILYAIAGMLIGAYVQGSFLAAFAARGTGAAVARSLR